jgi:hypothetical protein
MRAEYETEAGVGQDDAPGAAGRRQTLFREVNEQIECLAESLLLEAIPMLCECGMTDCKERIELTRAEYELLRLHPARFAVLAGHDIPAVERVVEENERFVVVEKLDESAAAAIEHDPRRRRRTGDGEARFDSVEAWTGSRSVRRSSAAKGS